MKKSMSHYDDCMAYRTKDGSLIRELMHPEVHGNAGQSIAEAIVSPGCATLIHRHLKSNEIYYVIAGKGVMSIDGKEFEIKEKDTVAIQKGLFHNVLNSGTSPLRILCACVPPYSHNDTELKESSKIHQ